MSAVDPNRCWCFHMCTSDPCAECERRHGLRVGESARVRFWHTGSVENDEPCMCHTDFTCMADEHGEEFE